MGIFVDGQFMLNGWKKRMGSGRVLCLLAGLATVGVPMVSYAAAVEKASGSVAALVERYPGGSIASLEIANEVLDAVKNEREGVKIRLEAQRRECYKKFLVNDCIEKAVEQERIDRKPLKELEIEANRFKRKEEVRLRDYALDQKREKEEADEYKREESKARYEEKVLKSQKKIEGGQDKSTEPTEKTLEGALRSTVLTPEQRAENRAKFEAKQVESEKRKKEVEIKQEKTRQKRARKPARPVAPPVAAPAPVPANNPG